MTSIRSLSELTAKLTARTSKVAGTIPEDPADKGTVSIPKDPSTTPAAQNLPPSGTNSGSTAPFEPPAVVTKPTTEPGSLTDKAASVLAGLKALVKPAAAPAAAAPTTKKAEANSAPAADASQPPGDTGVPDKTKAPTPDVKADSKGQLPNDGTNKDESAGKGEKVAGLEEFDSEFGRNLLCKLASSLLSTADGRAYAAQLIEQEAGAEAARDIVKAAAYAEEMLQSEETLEQEGALQAEQAWENISDADRQQIVKLAVTLDAARKQLQSPMELREFEEGVMASAALLQNPKVAAALGLNPEDAAPAPPVGGAGGSDPAADAAAGAPGDTEDPAMPEVSDEELDPEAVMQALQELVESGELEPEVAQEVVQALQEEMGGGEGGAPGGEAGAEGGAPAAGAPPADDGAAGAPPAEGDGAVPEGLKQAAVLTLAAMEA